MAFTITAIADRGAWIGPRTQSIEPGASATINISPSAGMTPLKLTIDDEITNYANPKVLTDVQSDHTVKLYTQTISGVIAASAGIYAIDRYNHFFYDNSMFSGQRPHTWRWAISGNGLNTSFTTQNFTITFPALGTYNVDFWCRNDMSQSSMLFTVEVQ